MRSLVLAALLWLPAFAQSNRTACSISPEVEKQYTALPEMSDLSLSWEERIAPRRALAKKYPSDWPLQFLLQDAIRRRFQLGREWDMAIAHYRALPDRTLGTLLEARLLMPFHRRRSREALEGALAQAADSPWTHLALLEWAGNRVDSDPALAEREFEEFRRLCPDSLLAFQFLEAVTDSERLYGHLRVLRRLLDSKKKTGLQEDEIPLFRTLWTWERVLYGEKRAGEFERAVRSDLAALRERPLYSSQAWYSALRFGYEHTLRDTATAQSVEEEILERAPQSQNAYGILGERWRKQNPAAQGPTREEANAYMELTEAFTLGQLERFRGQPFAGFAASGFLLNPQSELSTDEFVRLADFVLSSAERFPDIGASWPPVQILVAEGYTRRKIRLDRVPGLIETGLEAMEYQEKYRRDGDVFAKIRGRAAVVDNVAFAQSRAQEVLIRHALATGQTERSRSMLSHFRSELERTKPADNTGRQAIDWHRRHHTYLQLAKEAGIEAQPVAELLPPRPEQAQRHPVADFETRDRFGKTWRLADLKGKVTYISIWTTWCGPCRAEMPGIQKLHERWKDRGDRAVLTISADLQALPVESFLNQNPYSFPVIHGKQIAEKFFPSAYYPQNWLIDPAGRRLELRAPPAYDSTIPQIEDLAEKIEAAR